MSRKEELEKIIAEAEAELAPLKRKATHLAWAKAAVSDFKYWGLSREEATKVVNEVYDDEA